MLKDQTAPQRGSLFSDSCTADWLGNDRGLYVRQIHVISANTLTASLTVPHDTPGRNDGTRGCRPKTAARPSSLAVLALYGTLFILFLAIDKIGALTLADMKFFLFRIFVKLADIFRIWRYPVDRDPEQYSQKFLNKLYWWYKFCNPIVKAEKGSKLESYFTDMRRQMHQPILPEGFQCETSARISAVGDLMCAKNCDFIIVSIHWGMEFEFYPRQDQVDIAHYLIECGADAIISHHTHNIQPYEFYQTRRYPHRKAPIFYGLGNLSSLSSAPHRALSLITNLKVIKGHVNGHQKTLVARANVTPVLQVEYDCNEKPYLQIEKLNDLIKSARSKGRSEYVKKSEQYADLVIGRSWRN
jgi:hypothetical protein